MPRRMIMRPQRLIDINALSEFPDFGGIQVSEAHMNEAADHPEVKMQYPVITESLQLAASQQLRNMASLGGNVLQRTRCPYFRDSSWAQCNKRNPGSGCAAMHGFNRMHAVLGTSDACIATYAGDFAQALIALDASVEIAGPMGARSIAFESMHALPDSTPHVENTLARHEFIQAFVIPAGPWTRRSTYVKIRDRESYEFALASAAVALHLDGPIVTDGRIGLGGVATVPWRAKRAEEQLAGKPLNEQSAKLLPT
jgi:xanthine dehydrogenase YagS FAD-binding subunit